MMLSTWIAGCLFYTRSEGVDKMHMTMIFIDGLGLVPLLKYDTIQMGDIDDYFQQ